MNQQRLAARAAACSSTPATANSIRGLRHFEIRLESAPKGHVKLPVFSTSWNVAPHARERIVPEALLAGSSGTACSIGRRLVDRFLDEPAKCKKPLLNDHGHFA
jgi:hypothetical protein